MKELTILFLRRKSEILLAMKKRGFGEGRWNGVGGKVEPGETIIQAMCRETEEEIGVTPTDYNKVADITFNEVGTSGQHEALHVHVFECDSWQGNPVETEEMAPKWFSASEIPYQEMWADDIYWLPQILEGKKLVCTFTLDDSDQVMKKDINEVDQFPDLD